MARVRPFNDREGSCKRAVTVKDSKTLTLETISRPDTVGIGVEE